MIVNETKKALVLTSKLRYAAVFFDLECINSLKVCSFLLRSRSLVAWKMKLFQMPKVKCRANLFSLIINNKRRKKERVQERVFSETTIYVFC